MNTKTAGQFTHFVRLFLYAAWHSWNGYGNSCVRAKKNALRKTAGHWIIQLKERNREVTLGDEFSYNLLDNVCIHRCKTIAVA